MSVDLNIMHFKEKALNVSFSVGAVKALIAVCKEKEKKSLAGENRGLPSFPGRLSASCFLPAVSCLSPWCVCVLQQKQAAPAVLPASSCSSQGGPIPPPVKSHLFLLIVPPISMRLVRMTPLLYCVRGHFICHT